MLAYEVTVKSTGRKYLVVEEDSSLAKTRVVAEIGVQSTDLDVRHANEDDMRQRKVPIASWWGYTTKQSCWLIYQDCKARNEAKIIANYIF